MSDATRLKIMQAAERFVGLQGDLDAGTVLQICMQVCSDLLMVVTLQQDELDALRRDTIQ